MIHMLYIIIIHMEYIDSYFRSIFNIVNAYHNPKISD
jgi:hypothetical protein